MFFDPFFVPCSNVLCKLSAPTNFVPLSLMIVLGLPLRAINRMIVLRQLSVSNLGTTSICTALKVRHVQRQHHRSSCLRPIFTVNGPKYLTPTFVKAVAASNRSSGRSAITGVIVCALPFLQVTNLFLSDLNAFRNLRMHSFCWTMFLHAQSPRIDCPYARFARIIQPHGVSNVAILDALQWSPNYFGYSVIGSNKSFCI